MTIRIAAMLLAAVPALSGCGDAAPDAPAAMTVDPDAKTAKGTGTVTAVDAPAGRVTLDHQPIPAVGWPRMTMTFAAPPAQLEGVKPGDQVEFDLTVSRGVGNITAVRVK